MMQDTLFRLRKKEAEETRWKELAGKVEVKKVSPEEMEKIRPRKKPSTFFGTPEMPEEVDNTQSDEVE